ncbi:MAG: hypothetical protein JW981_11360 [Anaerolineae bacterium]|nr:hypothetical protein [Anaerolineae bacterium]
MTNPKSLLIDNKQLTQTAKELGYVLHAATKPIPVTTPPLWLSWKDANLQAIIDAIIEQSWPVAQIRKHLKALGLKPQGRSRADLTTQLITALLDKERLQEVISNLSRESLDFYIKLHIRSQLAEFYTDGPTRANITPAQELIATELSHAGLALLGENQDLLLLPAQIRYIPAVYLAVPSQLTSRTKLNNTITTSPQDLISKVQQFINLVQAETVSLQPELAWDPKGSNIRYYLRDRILPIPRDAHKLINSPQKENDINLLTPLPRLTEITRKKWGHILDLHEEGVEFLYQLLVFNNILRDGSPISIEPEFAQAFITLPPHKQLQTLLLTALSLESWAVFWPDWRADKLYVSWHYAPSYWHSNSYAVQLSRLITAQHDILVTLLAFLPHDTWIPLRTAQDILRPLIPSKEKLAKLQLNLAYTGVDQGWKDFLMQYMVSLVEGPLHWLGLADIALEDSTLQAFRLHHLQDIFFLRDKDLSFEQWKGEGAIHFIPEEENLLIEPPAPVKLLQHLQLWAEPKISSGKTMCYRQNLNQLHDSFEAGETPESLIKDWEESAGFPPPQAIRLWWEKWWSRYGHIRLYPDQTLLSVRDEFALQELQVAVPQLKEAILSHITPRTALLEAKLVEQLLEQMRNKGYMPKEEA